MKFRKPVILKWIFHNAKMLKFNFAVARPYFGQLCLFFLDEMLEFNTRQLHMTFMAEDVVKKRVLWSLSLVEVVSPLSILNYIYSQGLQWCSYIILQHPVALCRSWP
jgi:hypothetical protein